MNPCFSFQTTDLRILLQDLLCFNWFATSKDGNVFFPSAIYRSSRRVVVYASVFYAISPSPWLLFFTGTGSVLQLFFLVVRCYIYDIFWEPLLIYMSLSLSKKDWDAILACVEKEIQRFWKVNSSRGRAFHELNVGVVLMYDILKFFDFLELFAAMCSQKNFDTLQKDVEFDEDQKSLSGKPGIRLSSLIHFDLLFELPSPIAIQVT